MAQVDVNGTTLWYELEGTGTPCVALHGGIEPLYRGWRSLADEHRVLWFDQRGTGRSGRAGLETVSMEQLADDVAALLRHLDLGPATVFGHSYGGFVAQELALRHPDLVRALVLVATGPGQLGATEAAGEDGEGAPMPEALAAALGTPFASNDEMRAAIEVALRHYVHRADPQVLLDLLAEADLDWQATRRGFEVLASWSSVDRLTGLAAPTLVVGGRADPVTTWPQQVRIAKRAPGAHLLVLDEASHFVWVDRPEEFWAAVDAFLVRVGVR
jgi:pimeloyl-ACP methyl ester carboxylesterase